MTTNSFNGDRQDDFYHCDPTLKIETDFPQNPTIPYQPNSNGRDTSDSGKTLKINTNFRRSKVISSEEYQQRLIRLYIDYARRTGKIDYPPLKQFLAKFCVKDPNNNEVYAAEDFQAANLTEIIDCLRIIRDRVTEIISEIRSILNRAIAENKIDYLRTIREKYRNLAQYLETLGKISNKYGYLAKSPSQIVKIQDDIRYFCLYIEQFLEHPRSKQESGLNLSRHSNFRRCERYFYGLSDRVYTLANLLKTNIEYELN